MGIAVVLQDDSCNNISEIVLDTHGVMFHSLPDLSDTSYSCLRFINPYGDTIFNMLQAGIMIEEWDRLEQSFSDQNADSLWADIRVLIIKCAQEPHTYLKFIGE